jgi:hypothetical protein
VSLKSGSTATASLSGNTLTLGVPQGDAGQQGAGGTDGQSDIELSFSDGVLTITPK